ncbi:MAG: hypothetical protein ACRD8O_15305 [Bryobacteraceae bacterium]
MGHKPNYQSGQGNPIPQPALDRRASTRPPVPSCPLCNAPPEMVLLTARTAYLLYFKCSKCGGVWQGEKPEPGGRQRWDIP